MKLVGENRSARGKSCPSATLSTKNPTWTNQGSNSGLRGGIPATSRLSHGTAISMESVNHVWPAVSLLLTLRSVSIIIPAGYRSVCPCVDNVSKKPNS
jgi:hypothetical protein